MLRFNISHCEQLDVQNTKLYKTNYLSSGKCSLRLTIREILDACCLLLVECDACNESVGQNIQPAASLLHCWSQVHCCCAGQQQSVQNFLINLVHRQTNRQTDRQTQTMWKHYCFPLVEVTKLVQCLRHSCLVVSWQRLCKKWILRILWKKYKKLMEK